MTPNDGLNQLRQKLDQWATDLGFSDLAITSTVLSGYQEKLDRWLDAGYQGDMDWMKTRRNLRLHPEQLVPDTLRVILVRMPYFQPDTQPLRILENSDKAYISRYALGRDYHKLMRQRLAQLAGKIENYCEKELTQRAFVDSAPVMEKPLAKEAGLGWIGKNTLLLSESSGSWFFIGEIYTSLELPLDNREVKDQCGKCRACLTQCPTDAFPEPYVLDARRCISYLTIEHKGSIPVEFRQKMGNRVFGCDDCQLVCPWNREIPANREDDFRPRHNLDDIELTQLFKWTEKEFLLRTAGSPIRRVGYERWKRNLAVGLGNSNNREAALQALKQAPSSSAMVQEHIEWAKAQLISAKPNQ